MEKTPYLCTRLTEVRALSSVGLERLPYKQRVGGSNPSAPTKNPQSSGCGFFYIYIIFVCPDGLPPSTLLTLLAETQICVSTLRRHRIGVSRKQNIVPCRQNVLSRISLPVVPRKASWCHSRTARTGFAIFPTCGLWQRR